MVPLSLGRVKPLSTLKNEWKLGIKSLKELAKYAADAGIFMTIELINRYETFLLNNAEHGLRFINEVDAVRVKIMLDCFHMNIEERDYPALIRSVSDKLIQCM